MAAAVSATSAAAAGMEPTGVPAAAASNVTVSSMAGDKVQELEVHGKEDSSTQNAGSEVAPSGVVSFSLPLQELQGLTLADIRARVPKGMVPEPKVPPQGTPAGKKGSAFAGTFDEGEEGESREDRALRKSLRNQLAAAESACWDSSGSVDTRSPQLPGLLPVLLRTAVMLAAIVGVMLNTTARMGAPRLLGATSVAASVTTHAARGRGHV
jgi:hypothetical protein